MLWKRKKVDDYKTWLEKNSFSLLARPDTQKEAYKSFFDSSWSATAPKPFFQYEIYYAKLLKTRKSRPFQGKFAKATAIRYFCDFTK